MELDEMTIEELKECVKEQNDLIEKLTSDRRELSEKVSGLEEINDKLNDIIGKGSSFNSVVEPKTPANIDIDGVNYAVIKRSFRLPKNHNVIEVRYASDEELRMLLSIHGQTVLRKSE